MESKTVLQQPKTLYLQNKNSLDLSEENLDAQYGDNSLIVMKNDFYNDDFYDYKDTFLGKLDNKDQRKSNTNNNHVAKIETGEDYDDDLDEGATDDDDVDYDNDFTTGPLAIKKSPGDERNNNFGDNDMNFEQGKVNEEFTKMGMVGGYVGDDYEDQDLMMSETFFKRVDSLELCKPKKAKIVNNYLIGEILGDGSYGKVKECIDLESLSRRAVKIINLKTVARKIPRGVENVRKEISIMKRLHHKNLIKLYDTYEKSGQTLQQEQNEKNAEAEANKNMDELLAITSTMVNIEKPPKIYIFMDYCMTSLEKLIKTAPEQRLRNWQANHYFKQIIDGLEYLHSLNIIHNDIKPGNLLITCNDTIKICDFSISAELKIFYEHEYLKEKTDETNNNNYNNENDYDADTEINPQLLANNRNGVGGNNRSRFPIIQCTPIFQCPEMLDEDVDELMILKNAPKIDIWSTGITLFQLTTGQLPFPSQGQTIHQIFENIRSNSYEIKIPVFIDKHLRELLTNMLNRDPIKRWSIKQIRDADWFRKKHSLVPEDLANLPEDVVQNEYATFRMINYLEKLCQLKTVGELTSHDFSQFYDDMANQPVPHDQFNHLNLNNDKPDFSPSNSNHHNHHPNGSSDSSPNHQQSLQPKTNQQRQQQSKSYAQATKVKKTHCSLM